ncbi:uncharacterized protein LOC135399646 isoform X1 [Ornithodoros turicata]|uniref:uncharacterized protein LOC135399646 isoform X1 n=1 Tax=Ornithodoros turicata TaxID=34597 RepID=UPI003138AB1E
MSSAKIAPVSSKEGDVRVSSKKNKTLTAVVRKKSDTDIGGNLQQTGELVRGQRSWVGSLTALASPRRGYSDGNVPRNVGTSTSMETPALGRKAGRKRVVDVGQKTLRQMNELAKYVNASGPCAICRNPGAVITMTQIRRRRRKLKRQMSKLTEHQRVSSPFLTAVGSPSLDSTRQRRKSVTWIGPPSTSHLPEPGDELHQGTVAIPEPSSGPEVVSQETGAFLLLISVVAFVVGILFMVKSTENSVREYLGMATPLASATASNRDLGRLLSSEIDTDDAEDTTVFTVAEPTAEEAAATTIQRWYRRYHGTAPTEMPDAAKKRRLDRWTENLRGFFSRKKLNYLKGIPRLWSKKRGGTDRSSQPMTEGQQGAIQAAPSAVNVCRDGSNEIQKPMVSGTTSSPSFQQNPVGPPPRRSTSSDAKRVTDKAGPSGSQMPLHRTRSLV